MLAQQNGKVAVAALGTLLVGSGLGWVPVARFVGAKPSPIVNPDRTGCWPPMPPAPAPATASKGSFKAGPLTVEAMLSQSRIHAGSDGLIYVDVKLTADTTPDTGERRPIDFALVLDVSGSMADENKIGLMKQACAGLQQHLTAQDRVSVVSFSTSARTVLGLQKPSSEYQDAIRQLAASGGTNISAGLELGAEELRRAVRPGAARRIILLTDGHPTPNVGDWTPEGLRGVCKRFQQQGISVSAVGLGLDYNSKLLSDMAEAGGGSYHYVDSGQRIAGIYDAELRSLRTLVARGVSVSIEPVNGAQLVDVIEWTGERNGQALTVNAGDFESGRATKIVARLRARTWRDGCETKGGAPSSHDLIKVSVRGEDALRSSTFGEGPLVLGAELTNDAQVAQRSVIVEAQKDVEDAEVGDLLEKARVRAERGDTAGARGYFEQLKAKRADVSYQAGDGKTEKMNVDQLQKAYETGSTEERQRANMFSRSAASKASR